MRRESSCSSSSCGNSTYRTAVKPRSKPWQLYSPAIKYGTWLGSHLKMDMFLEKSFVTSGIIRIFHCRAWLEEGIKKLYNPNTFSPYGHLLSGSASPSKVQTHDEFVWPEMDSLNLGLELWFFFCSTTLVFDGVWTYLFLYLGIENIPLQILWLLGPTNLIKFRDHFWPWPLHPLVIPTVAHTQFPNNSMDFMSKKNNCRRENNLRRDQGNKTNVMWCEFCDVLRSSSKSMHLPLDCENLDSNAKQIAK